MSWLESKYDTFLKYLHHTHNLVNAIVFEWFNVCGYDFGLYLIKLVSWIFVI